MKVSTGHLVFEVVVRLGSVGYNEVDGHRLPGVFIGSDNPPGSTTRSKLPRLPQLIVASGSKVWIHLMA